MYGEGEDEKRTSSAVAMLFGSFALAETNCCRRGVVGKRWAGSGECTGSCEVGTWVAVDSASLLRGEDLEPLPDASAFHCLLMLHVLPELCWREVLSRGVLGS